jgi:Flp pilus assembly protein TadD
MQQLGGDFQARGAEGTVDTLRDAHQWSAALRAAETSAKAMPGNRDVQLTYARQLADGGKLDQGVRLAEAQLKNTAEDRDVYVTIADMQSRNKQWKPAFDSLDKAEKLATKPEEKLFVYYLRGSMLEREKLYDQAEEQFRKALAIDANNAAIENDYGYMLAERGMKLSEATAMLQKAVHFDPQNGAYLDSLGWAYYRQGQFAMAEEYARKAALRQPNDPSILSHLGEIYAHNGKLSMAVVEWEHAARQYASSLPPEADPADVSKTQHDLETARVRLARAGSGPGK